jgi:hypothetical protein
LEQALRQVLASLTLQQSERWLEQQLVPLSAWLLPRGMASLLRKAPWMQKGQVSVQCWLMPESMGWQLKVQQLQLSK